MDTIIRRGHPIAFGFLILFATIEMSISAWITARYNSHGNNQGSSIRSRVRFLLFLSLWTMVFGTVYIASFLFAVNSLVSSVASHFVFLAITWVLWLAGAAAITQTLGGSLNCTQSFFIYCGQLNALMGFAWLIFVLITFLLIAVLVRGIRSAKSGDGLRGGLVDA